MFGGMAKKTVAQTLAMGRFDSQVEGIRLPADRRKLNHSSILGLDISKVRGMLHSVLEAEKKLDMIPRQQLYIDEVSVLRAILKMAENDLWQRLKIHRK